MKILNGKTGIKKFVCITLTFVMLSALVGCGNASSVGIIGGSDGPTSIYVSKFSKNQIEELFNSKTENIGNASEVSKILEQCPAIKDIEYNGMELKTEEEPYTILRNCTFAGGNLDEVELRNQACIVLSLVENAECMQFYFEDGIYSYSRVELDTVFDKTLSEYSDSLENFEELFEVLSKSNK